MDLSGLGRRNRWRLGTCRFLRVSAQCLLRSDCVAHTKPVELVHCAPHLPKGFLKRICAVLVLAKYGTEETFKETSSCMGSFKHGYGRDCDGLGGVESDL